MHTLDLIDKLQKTAQMIEKKTILDSEKCTNQLKFQKQHEKQLQSNGRERKPSMGFAMFEQLKVYFAY